MCESGLKTPVDTSSKSTAQSGQKTESFLNKMMPTLNSSLWALLTGLVHLRHQNHQQVGSKLVATHRKPSKTHFKPSKTHMSH